MPALDIPTILGKLHVVDDGDTSQPAVVLWPSLFTSHDFYKHQLPALRSSGYRTLAIDPPGHGQSTAPGLFTMDQCAQAVEEIVTARGIKEYSYIGTSWGGFVGLRLQGPRKLVLLNTSADAPTMFERVRAAILVHMLWWPSLDNFVNIMIASTMLSQHTRQQQPQLGSQIMGDFRKGERLGYCNAVQSVLVDRDAAPIPTTEALVISGSEDKLFPTTHARRIADAIGGTLAELKVSHLAALEAPDEVNELILRYLAS